MNKIPSKWIVIAAVVYSALILCSYLFVILPKDMAIKRLKADLRAIKSSSGYKLYDEKILGLRKNLSQTYLSLEKGVLDSEKSLLVKLGVLSQRSQVKIISVIPFTEKEYKGSLIPVSADIVFSGSYRQIVDFIYLLETDKVFFRIEKIALQNTGSDKTHRAEAKLRAYTK